MANKGIFGKLPAHGDFVQRELPSSFVDPWDAWLQRAVHGAREVVGVTWLDYYLTSPIWRFAFSSGVVDHQCWAGVLVPSVDSVGRYFPLTLATPLPAEVNPYSLMTDAEEWFESLSTLSVEALQNSLSVDQLLECFPSVPVPSPELALSNDPHGIVGISGGATMIDTYPALLNSLTKRSSDSYSLWWCSGSEHLPTTSMISPGLPDPSVYCAMLGASGHRW
ncbi:type VI secretion system-associated protein TagF [Microbulbifer agarilyticus]